MRSSLSARHDRGKCRRTSDKRFGRNRDEKDSFHLVFGICVHHNLATSDVESELFEPEDINLSVPHDRGHRLEIWLPS